MDSVPSTSAIDTVDSRPTSAATGVSLDYSARGLDAMPVEFATASNAAATLITELDLSRNAFATLPVELFALTQLEILDLGSNALHDLPDDIATLASLRCLDLRNNALATLPNAIGKLRSLEVLILSGNRFQEIPAIVFELSSLRELHMGANQLHTIPSDISRLENLEILYLGDNRLESVPQSLGSLKKLSALALAQNQLESLPNSFAQLTSLRTLVVHNNRLQALPTGITRLPHLDRLNIRNNPLKLAAQIVKLKFEPQISYLPPALQHYLSTAKQCVNPQCAGVYFAQGNAHVKFVDFCGRYRVPLLEYLCSQNCQPNAPAHAILTLNDEKEKEVNNDDEITQLPLASQQRRRMNKVLLG